MNTLPRCPHCHKPMDKPVSHEVVQQDRDPITGRHRVRTRMEEFCSDQCGKRYQDKE